MKPVGDKVLNQVRDHVRHHAWLQVQYLAFILVEDQVYHQVWNQVQIQARNQS